MQYRLLVCAGIHDDLEALAGFTSFARRANPDYIMVAGDLGLELFTLAHVRYLHESDPSFLPTERTKKGFLRRKRIKARRTLRQVKRLLDETRIDYMLVGGEFDDNKDLRRVFRRKDIHRKRTKLWDAKVLGYGGGNNPPSYIRHRLQTLGENTDFNEWELADLLEREQPDIALAHVPPLGLTDPKVKERVVDNLPKLWVSGHLRHTSPYFRNEGNGVKTYPNGGEKRSAVIHPGNLGRFYIPEGLGILREGVETYPKGNDLPFGTFFMLDVEGDGTLIQATAYTVMNGDHEVGEARELLTIPVNEARPSRIITQRRKLILPGQEGAEDTKREGLIADILAGKVNVRA